ncbi:MAG: VCBS repeat-containing protein [Saprospiraceae bacterium]|nr:VCBS repeat-containing protein [Saprospiraceae bacterium]
MTDTIKKLQAVTLLLCSTFALLAQEGAFVDVSSGLDLFAFGGVQGIAVGDYNNDGFDDLYVSADVGRNKLFQNNGDGSFSEVASSLGLDIAAKSKSAIWGDINNDGYPDLYLANLISNDQLFLNQGDGTFRDITSQAGIENLANPSSVNMADVNNDGFLDIYVSNLAAENILYLNQKDLSFQNYTQQSGATDTGSSMGSIFFDYDKDGDQDLFLTHDHAEPSFLYQNDGTGHFTEVGETANANVQGLGMGIDIGDINRDGYTDIYITNLFKNTLLLNKGDGTFENISASAGIEDYGMGWGTTFIDYDRDGWVDIYVANDSDFSPYPNVLYRNLGDHTFSAVELQKAVSSTAQSYAAVCLDYQQDGQLDMAVANRGVEDHFQLFENTNRTGNWIGIKLTGVESNQNAIGTKLRMVDEFGHIHYKELTAGHGWTSQNSAILFIGLGEATAIDSLSLSWPSGLEQQLDGPAINQYYTIVEGDLPMEGIISKPLITATPLLDRVDSGLQVRVFPNPAHDRVQLQVESENLAELEIKVFDVLGTLQYTQHINRPVNKNQPIELDLSRFSQQRLLFLQVRSANQVATQKVILEHRL